MSKISYAIKGSDLQYVEVTLPPNATIFGEQGAMMYMDDQLTVTTVLGDGSSSNFGLIGRLFKAINRVFTGESLFSNRYQNFTKKAQRISFATPGVSKILAMDLDDMGGSIICQKGAYLAGEEGIKVQIAWQKRLKVGFLGGEGFIMQRITGNGVVFINSFGGLAEIELAPTQNLRVDSGCLVACTPSVTYDVKYAGKISTALLGGEGFFHVNVTGPGKIWIQSLPEKRFFQQLTRAVGASQANWFRIVAVLLVIPVIGVILAGLISMIVYLLS